MSINRVLLPVLGISGSLRSDQDTSDNSYSLHHVPEIGGAAVSSGNPMPVTDATGVTARGTIADAAWSGSGSGSVIAILKALWAALTGTLLVSTRNGITITQTTYTLAANTDVVIAAANANRRFLHVINIDTGYASLGFGTTAVVASGLPLDAAGVTGQQGGGFTWGAANGPPLGAVHAISALGTRIVVLDGT